MPRPSLKDQRSKQILDAYLTSVARFGLDGATQERIATEAGVKRPLLRHYLGNKEEMILALADHVVLRFAVSTDGLREALSTAQSAKGLVDILYTDGAESDPRLMLAWQALTFAAAEYPDMRQPLLDSLSRLFDVIEGTLRRIFPQAENKRVRAVTQGIAAPFLNCDAMAPLNPPDSWREDLKQAAIILAESLEHDT